MPRRQARGIQPDAHRVVARAEDEDVGDAGHAFQRVLDVDVDVVGQEQGVVLALIGVGAGRHDEVGGRLLHRHAELTDFRRQPSERLVDAVLHVDGGKIRIARGIERDDHRARAAVGARGGHVEHPLDAVDRLLERRGHGGLDGLGVGAGVDGDDTYRRRRHLRILRDRHARDGEHPGEDDDERADGRENRTADEGIDKHQESGLRAHASGLTGTPSCSFWRFETISFSPSLIPLRTI